MKITICSSIFFVKEGYEIKKLLEEKGHTVFIYPKKIEFRGERIPVIDYYNMRKEKLREDILEKKKVFIDDHIKKIKDSDAILVLNFEKDGKKGYIGGNTFLEMAIAYYLNKKIFLWEKPNQGLPYYEEIVPLNPSVIKGNLEHIK